MQLHHARMCNAYNQRGVYVTVRRVAACECEIKPISVRIDSRC